MQIQLRKGVSVRCAEAVLWSATHDTAAAEDWLGRKSSAKTVVEEGAKGFGWQRYREIVSVTKRAEFSRWRECFMQQR
jgi:hypothetical protein